MYACIWCMYAYVCMCVYESILELISNIWRKKNMNVTYVQLSHTRMCTCTMDFGPNTLNSLSITAQGHIPACIYTSVSSTHEHIVYNIYMGMYAYLCVRTRVHRQRAFLSKWMSTVIKPWFGKTWPNSCLNNHTLGFAMLSAHVWGKGKKLLSMSGTCAVFSFLNNCFALS